MSALTEMKDDVQPYTWRWAAYLPALLAAGLAAYLLSWAPDVIAGNAVRVAWDWVPSMGIQLSFNLDGLSLTFGLMITIIGAVVFLYTPAYFGGKPGLARMLWLLTAFMLSMLGMVMADNMIAMFVFWEGTTITSFLLIGYSHRQEKARKSAQQALLVTGAGGLALLAGLLMLYGVTGTMEFSELAAYASDIKADPLYLGILFAVLLGAFTKSAQFPFHFWLPGAMAAPTPVSAYLHSATMVKAGIYLMARLHPTLGGTDVWMWTLTIAGAITAVLSAIWAMRQTDLKLMLAYTTVMALGTLTMFLGGASEVALVAAATFLVVHALYKASLFLVIGIIDVKAGTREHARLAGLAKAMPITATIAAFAALSMAGFPPFLGFIGKELKYEGALAVASEPWLVTSAAVLANALMVAVAMIVAVKPFWRGKEVVSPKPAMDPPATMWAGPALLAILGLMAGLWPALVGPTLVIPAAESIAGGEIDKYLALWHGVNLPLMLSFLTVGLGLTFYWQRDKLAAALAGFELRFPKASGDHGYLVWLNGLKSLAAWTNDVLQGGRLQTYTRMTLATLAIVLWATLFIGGFGAVGSHPLPSVVEIILGLSGLAGVGLAILTRSRLTAICALGVVGIVVALVFVLYGAVDVAMTQLLVETLVVVLAAMALRRLPQLLDPASGASGGIRWVDLFISLTLGLAVTLTLLGVSAEAPDRRLTDYFEITSVPEAFGRNIVNVILVDFRAIDTLGEIAVVVVAALSAYAVLRMRSKEERDAEAAKDAMTANTETKSQEG